MRHAARRRRHAGTPLEIVPDLARHPELRFLDRWHWLPPAALALGRYLVGALLERRASVPRARSSWPGASS